MFNGIVVLWFVIGLLLTVGAVYLLQYLRRSGKRTTWYDWLVGFIGLVMLLFSLQNFYGGFMEQEPLSSWMFLLFPGLPALVLMAIPAVQIWRRNRTA